jgi:hypothetical protein
MPGIPLAAGATSFLDLLPLALWSAFYPTLLALVVVILGRPQPLRLLLAYYLGGMTMSFVAGAVLIAAFNAGHDVGASNRSIGPAVDFAIGALALLFFWVLLTGRDREVRERRTARKAAKQADKPPEEDRDPWSQRILDRQSAGLTFAVSLFLNLPGGMYIVALKDIAQSNVGTGQTILWVVLYNLIQFLLAEIPLVFYLVAPDATRAKVMALNHWLGGHGRQIAMGLCITAGAFLVIRGVVAVS